MTRRHLLEAAAIVFAQKGFHAATLDEVAAAAGFTKGAVYSNFKSKDDLFLALFDDRIERQFAVTIEVLEDGSHDMTEQLPAYASCSTAARSSGTTTGRPCTWSSSSTRCAIRRPAPSSRRAR